VISKSLLVVVVVGIVAMALIRAFGWANEKYCPGNIATEACTKFPVPVLYN
jgi:hypothetical protein